ncbi:hypothetical protein ABZ570_28875 [Micromonospora sp. NPDC007271]|uniref:hypothetical protein n=1 Tax=Micromonospora sp. NPDC007271 TaxID=3154587 RepID=UPI0033CA1CF6
MPAPVASAEKRNRSLLTVLFWAGVALAPLAALILLVADGGGLLRIGAVLAILAVVLIGLSIALRGDDGAGAAGAEELRDEIEQLRHELRNEIVAAAQRGNQALDQVQRTQERVTALRRRLDAAAAGIAAAAAGITAPAAEEPAGGRARVPAAEAYDEGRPRHGAAPEQVPGGQPAGRDEDASPRRPQSGVYGAPRAVEPEVRSEPRPVGVVHRTETVHVTTRHTIVDGGVDSVGGTRYGGYAGRWSPDPEERPGSGDEPAGRPRSGYRDAVDDRGWSGGDHGRPGQGGYRDGAARAGGHSMTGSAGARDGGLPGDDRGWTAGRADSESWSTRPADSRSWSATVDQPAAPQSWSVAPDGSADPHPWAGPREAAADPRSWAGPREGTAGRDGRRDDRSWSPGPDESRDEGPWAARPGRPEGWDRGDEGWGPRPEGWDRGDEGWTSPDVPARAESSGRALGADDPDGEYWSELRAGNRWASVRDDERGREIRVGERRAAVHAAGGGTEYRVEDRWASVREPRRDDDPRAEAGWAEESRPALPAGGVPVPDEWRPPRQRSGRSEWHRAEPEPVRYGDERYDGRDAAPRAGGARSADRWR